jgi:hypothetical protein
MGLLDKKVAVWIASAATAGRTGMEVRVLTPRFMLAGLLREAGRRLTGRAQPIEALQIQVIPSMIAVRIDE